MKHKFLTRTHVKTRTTAYIGTVPNNSKGRATVTHLRTLLKPFGRITCMGRNPDRKGVAERIGKSRGYTPDVIKAVHQSYRSSIPRGLSTRWDVYIVRTDGNQLDFKASSLAGIPPYWKLPLGALRAVAMIHS